MEKNEVSVVESDVKYCKPKDGQAINLPSEGKITYNIELIGKTALKVICRFYVIFPAFCRLRRADSMYIHQYTLAFKQDFVLEQRSTSKVAFFCN